MALTSLVEALALAASRVLQIDEGELSGWWTPVMGGRGDEAQLYLYDLLPGGAGYARAVGDALGDVLDATEALLSGCDCPSSCYRCIRHYGNNWIHSSLDRHLAVALLRHLRTAELPSLSDAHKDASLSGLREVLSLRGVTWTVRPTVDGERPPLVIHRPQGDLRVDVHHPLIEPTLSRSPGIGSARSSAMDAISLDAFELLHDLPAAVVRLQLPGTLAG
jgi:hypothetical protein